MTRSAVAGVPTGAPGSLVEVSVMTTVSSSSSMSSSIGVTSISADWEPTGMTAEPSSASKSAPELAEPPTSYSTVSGLPESFEAPSKPRLRPMESGFSAPFEMRVTVIECGLSRMVTVADPSMTVISSATPSSVIVTVSSPSKLSSSLPGSTLTVACVSSSARLMLPESAS
jgi:hypothetical protein